MGASGGGGVDMIRNGAAFQAASLRSAIPSIFGAAKFNQGVVGVNLQREVGALTNTMTRTLSTQRAQAGSSGFSVGSKSFQAISVETTEVVLNAARDARSNAHIEQQRIWYDAVTRATALENQARGAIYQGEIQAYQAQQQQNRQRLSSMNSLMSGIGGLF